MNEQFIESYKQDALEAFRNYKKLAERAIEQIKEDEYFRAIDEESNSIAVIVKHLGGNLRSRWSNFLTEDGEKPDRDRDGEFVSAGDTRESLTELWEVGWHALFETLENLSAADFGKTVKIRGEDYTVVKAINRALAHAAYHIGQITFLAKHFRSAEWKTLSIARGRSGDFNAFLAENKDEQTHYLDAARRFNENKPHDS
jgi:hypothetical protein